MKLRGLIKPILITLSKAMVLVIGIITVRLSEHLAMDYVKVVGTRVCTEAGE